MPNMKMRLAPWWAEQALLEPKELTEAQKLDAVADIDCIQSQLAKSEPNRSIIRSAWDGLTKLNTTIGLGEKVAKVAGLLGPFLS